MFGAGVLGTFVGSGLAQGNLNLLRESAPWATDRLMPTQNPPGLGVRHTPGR